ncbi:MAG: uroporphyrinogen-III C-methyltransferase [Pseudolabrys sp.]
MIDPHDALTALRGRFPVLEPGHVWLVGAGPGDPGFLTLDAVAGLVQADVVLHDALIDERVLALAGPQTRLEFAGKRGGQPSTRQSDISLRLVELARARQRVVRLKGGDPFIFGRGGEEAMALAAAGIPYRIVSGVTAAIAAAAVASVPMTLRGVNQAIILAAGHSGAENEFDWAALARTGQPIVIYMAMRNVEAIVAALTRGGLAGDTPAAVIVAATTPQEQVVISRLDCLIDDMRTLGAGLPGLVIVGDIVAKRDRLLQLVAEVEVAR